MVIYTNSTARIGNGLIFGQLARAAPGVAHWRFTALGMARPGNTAQELIAGFAAEAANRPPAPTPLPGQVAPADPP